MFVKMFHLSWFIPSEKSHFWYSVTDPVGITELQVLAHVESDFKKAIFTENGS